MAIVAPTTRDRTPRESPRTTRISSRARSSSAQLLIRDHEAPRPVRGGEQKRGVRVGLRRTLWPGVVTGDASRRALARPPGDDVPGGALGDEPAGGRAGELDLVCDETRWGERLGARCQVVGSSSSEAGDAPGGGVAGRVEPREPDPPARVQAELDEDQDGLACEGLRTSLAAPLSLQQAGSTFCVPPAPSAQTVRSPMRTPSTIPTPSSLGAIARHAPRVLGGLSGRRVGRWRGAVP